MNRNELSAAIKKSGVSKRYIATQLGISAQALYNKISGYAEFKGSEIKKISNILNLSMEAVNTIFFGGEVN